MPATRVGVVKGCDWLRLLLLLLLPLMLLVLLLLLPLLLQLLRWLLLLLQERCGGPACDTAAERWGSKDQRCAFTGAKYNTTTQCNTSAFQPVCSRTLACTKPSSRTQRRLLECVFWKHVGPESVGPEREIRRRLRLEHGRRINFAFSPAVSDSSGVDSCMVGWWVRGYRMYV